MGVMVLGLVGVLWRWCWWRCYGAGAGGGAMVLVLVGGAAASEVIQALGGGDGEPLF